MLLFTFHFLDTFIFEAEGSDPQTTATGSHAFKFLCLLLILLSYKSIYYWKEDKEILQDPLRLWNIFPFDILFF